MSRGGMRSRRVGGPAAVGRSKDDVHGSGREHTVPNIGDRLVCGLAVSGRILSETKSEESGPDAHVTWAEVREVERVEGHIRAGEKERARAVRDQVARDI